MTPDEARATLEATFIAAFSAAHPTYDYFIEGVNAPDMIQQKVPFAMFKVCLPRVEQLGMNGDTPPRWYYGEVEIGLFVPDGSGTKPFFDMQQTVDDNLAVRSIGEITLRGITPIARVPAIGWQGRHLVIPYKFDSI